MMNDVKIYLSSDLYDYTIKYLIMQAGKTLAFNFNGTYKGEAKPYDFGKIDEVDLVSILQYEGGYELATHVNRRFKKLKPNIPLIDVYNNINNHNGVLLRGVRGGVKDGAKFKQYFFAVTPNTLNVSIFE